MALRTETFDDLIQLISATMGLDVASDSKMLTRAKSLINLAARRAKDATDYWERMLVIGEPRTVTRGYVQSIEDSFHVYGAGTDEANGLYVRNGSNDGNPSYTLYDSDGTTAVRNLWFESGSPDRWYITSTAIGTPPAPDYQIVSSATTPPLSGWSAINNGTSPAPLLVDVADIDYPLYWQKFDPQDYESRSYEFRVDANGIKPYGGYPEDESIIYVTYKKQLTDVYGDGTAGTTTSIPAEWFNYMALYTMYMLQQSMRQSNGNPAYTIALREVERSLEDEMMKMEATGVANTVRQHVETRIAYSNIL